MRLGTRSLIAAAAVGLLLANVGRIPYLEIGQRVSAITLLDLVLIPLWLHLGITLASRRRRWKLDPVSRAGLLFSVVALVSLVVAAPKWGLTAGQLIGSGAYLLRWVLYAGWFVLIVTDPDPDEAGRTAWSRLDAALIAIAAFGIVQSAFLPGFAQMVDGAFSTGIPWDEQGRRLVSTILDPNLAGGLFAIAVLMRVARVAEGVPTHRGVLLLFGVAIVLTLSRSAVLALGAGLLVIVAVRGLTRPMVRLGAAALLLLVPVLPALIAYAIKFEKLTVDASAMLRLVSWFRGGILVRDNPVLGVGFNATAYAQQSYGWESVVQGDQISLDGGLLFVAVMTGLLGLAVYVWMVGAFAAAARRTWRSVEETPERRAFAVGALAATVAVLFQSFFLNALLSPWFLVPLWVLWARVTATAPQAARRTARAASIKRGALYGTASLAMVVALSGCDPCAGVPQCTTGPERIAAGTILDRDTRQAAEGVTVAAAGRMTTTNSAGRWRIVLPSLNDSVVTFTVTRAPGETFTVADVRVRSTSVYGDAHDLGVWYDRPYVSYVIGIFRSGVPLRNAQLRFTTSAADGGFVMEARTSDIGYALLEGPALRVGQITGTLRVTHSSIGTRDLANVRIDSDFALVVETIRQNLAIDRQFNFGGVVLHRGTGANSPGSTIRFTRTGGLEISPNPVTVTAGAVGFFILGIRPFGYGEVIGTLRITPPGGGAPHDYPGVRLASYDSTEMRFMGVWHHSERWAWDVEVRYLSDSTPVNKILWQFARDSGLVLSPSGTLWYETTPEGLVTLRASVSDTGVVRGELFIHQGGQPVRSAGILRLRSFAADTVGFAGVRYIGDP